MSEKKGDDEMPVNEAVKVPQTSSVKRRVASNEEVMKAAAQEMKKFGKTLEKLAKN